MNKNMKKTLSLVMAGVLVLGLSTPDADAAKKVKLSKSKVTVKVGKTVVLKVKNAKAKAKWSVKSGKKNISLSKKKKASVTIKGKKAGNAVVQAKIGKKKLTCKVTVKKAATNAAPAVTDPATTPAADVTAVPTSTPATTDAPATVAPTSTPEPTPPGFVYEGLDTSWIDPTKPMVAFTFDDGPGGNGPAIQEILANAGAHATFFYIGQNVESESGAAEVLAAVANGFEVGNHSYGYGSLDTKEAEDLDDFVGVTDRILTEVTGFTKFLFRAPNLAYSDTMYANIAAPFIDCAVDSKDWDNATAEEIVANVTAAKDGDIVLMHVNQAKTLEALPAILEYYAEAGIQIVSVSELFAVRGEALADGVQYGSCPAAN